MQVEVEILGVIEPIIDRYEVVPIKRRDKL